MIVDIAARRQLLPACIGRWQARLEKHQLAGSDRCRNSGRDRVAGDVPSTGQGRRARTIDVAEEIFDCEQAEFRRRFSQTAKRCDDFNGSDLVADYLRSQTHRANTQPVGHVGSQSPQLVEFPYDVDKRSAADNDNVGRARLSRQPIR